MKKLSQDPQMNPPTGKTGQGRRPSGTSPVDNILGSGESIVHSCQEENHLSVGDGLAPKPRVGRHPLKHRYLIETSTLEESLAAEENNPSPAGEAEGGRRPSGASPAGDGAGAESPKPRVGRPLKYRHLIDILEDDTLYSPASIVRNGEEKGLLPVPDGDVPFSPADQERSEQAMRIRHSLARFADNHKFPRPSEGFVKLFGQAPAPGWFGATWKAALPQ